MTFRHFAAVLIMFAPGLSWAGAESFDCVVTSVHAVGENGEIVTDTAHLTKQIGSTFSVERRTGAIRGGYFIHNRDSAEIKVINEPADNSYYVISTSHGPKKVDYLYIANHRKWHRKPFTYTYTGEYVYSGYCV